MNSKKKDRPWNDPGPRRGKTLSNSAELAARPTLRAVILDFTAVNFLDVTAAQALIDLRSQFDRYADPDRVEWHFAGVANRWTKRALVASGFGADDKREGGIGNGLDGEDKGGSAKRLIGVAEAGVVDGVCVDGKGVALRARAKEVDVEAAAGAGAGGEGGISPVPSSSEAGGVGRRLVPLYGVNRPYFHVDVETAVAASIRSLEGRGSDWSGRE